MAVFEGAVICKRGQYWPFCMWLAEKYPILLKDQSDQFCFQADWGGKPSLFLLG